jgi:hypothetical protein
MEPRNRFQGIDSAGLCSLGGPVRQLGSGFLVPRDCSKIPALKNQCGSKPQVQEEEVLTEEKLRPSQGQGMLVIRFLKEFFFWGGGLQYIILL